MAYTLNNKCAKFFLTHSSVSTYHQKRGHMFFEHNVYHNTMKPNIPVLDWMFSSSSWFVHLQNKQKQTSASDNHAATTSET